MNFDEHDPAGAPPLDAWVRRVVEKGDDVDEPKNVTLRVTTQGAVRVNAAHVHREATGIACIYVDLHSKRVETPMVGGGDNEPPVLYFMAGDHATTATCTTRGTAKDARQTRCARRRARPGCRAAAAHRGSAARQATRTTRYRPRTLNFWAGTRWRCLRGITPSSPATPACRRRPVQRGVRRLAPKQESPLALLRYYRNRLTGLRSCITVPTSTTQQERQMQHAAQATAVIPAGMYDGIYCVEQRVEVIGTLTTEHAASSYGMPVFVASVVNGPRFAGRVIDPAELERVALAVELEDEHTASNPDRLLAAAKRAGYNL